VSAGLPGKPDAEDCGGDTGHGATEPPAALASAHRLPTGLPRIGEVEIFDGDSAGAVPQAVTDEPCDGMPDLGIASGSGSAEVEIDAPWAADAISVGVEAADGQVAVVETSDAI
jgi:hypothetical protein